MVTIRIEPGATIQERRSPASALRYIPAYVLRQLPAHVVRADRALPVGLDGEVLVLAVENPADFELQERIQYIAGRELRVIAAAPARIAQAITEYYPACEEEHELDEELSALD